MSIIKLNRLFMPILLMLIFTISNINAENFSGAIKGKVFSEDNTPLYGAHVAIPSINRGAVTDENGEFAITNLPYGKHRVVISYIGYESQTINVELNNNQVLELNVHLKPTTINTEPVIVTGILMQLILSTALRM